MSGHLARPSLSSALSEALKPTAPPFTVGQRVVSTKDWTPAQVALDIAVPKPGAVYTVRAVIPPENRISYWSLLLVEIKNRTEPGALHECSFNANGFEVLPEGESALRLKSS